MAKTASKKKVQYFGTGRRKSAVARVRLVPGGEGTITINKQSIDEYFGLETMKLIVRQPLMLTDSLTKYDVLVNVCGGGYTGQAGAIRHGIARAGAPRIRRHGAVRDPGIDRDRIVAQREGRRDCDILRRHLKGIGRACLVAACQREDQIRHG